MENCIFCKIINGEIPCRKIYEDNDVIAFLDINPQSKGHTLVIPKEHSTNIYEISKESLQKTMDVVQKISSKINNVYKPLGVKIIQNNGEKAGQSVFHFHVHIKPIYENTKDMDTYEILNMSDEEFESVVKELTLLEEL